jgi:omega-amidase
MNIYCVQLDIAWEDKQTNFANVQAWLKNAVIKPGSLILLPEMFATGFSMNKETISRHEPETTETFLQNLSEELQAYLMGGLVTLDEDGMGENWLYVCGPVGETIAMYQKMHPFSFGGETKHYRSGDSLALFDWHQYTVAPFICYDLRFPEVFRHAVQLGANVITVCACWPQAREAHWVALLKARAIENQAYVAAVNRCGSDPKLSYSGRSLIIDPRGDILADGGHDEGVIHTTLDFDSLSAYRREFPALADIRDGYKFD